MTVLHLGVVELPYGHEAEQYTKKGSRRKDDETLTTGDVAEILENKYHVMEIFFELHKQEIADWATEGLQGTMENLLSGAPVEINPFGGAMAEIEKRFRAFLRNREMDALGYPGVPTKASLEGVNHRLSHPYASKNKSRPSFIDTGLYQSSFKAWVD